MLCKTPSVNTEHGVLGTAIETQDRTLVSPPAQKTVGAQSPMQGPPKKRPIMPLSPRYCHSNAAERGCLLAPSSRVVTLKAAQCWTRFRAPHLPKGFCGSFLTPRCQTNTFGDVARNCCYCQRHLAGARNWHAWLRAAAGLGPPNAGNCFAPQLCFAGTGRGWRGD